MASIGREFVDSSTGTKNGRVEIRLGNLDAAVGSIPRHEGVFSLSAEPTQPV